MINSFLLRLSLCFCFLPRLVDNLGRKTLFTSGSLGRKEARDSGQSRQKLSMMDSPGRERKLAD